MGRKHLWSIRPRSGRWLGFSAARAHSNGHKDIPGARRKKQFMRISHLSQVLRLAVAALLLSHFRNTGSPTLGAGDCIRFIVAIACSLSLGSNSHGQLGNMSPNRQSFIAQPRAVSKLADFPVEIISCGPATVVALCARGQNEADVLSPLQPQGAGGSPRTPLQIACTPMWLGDLPYWKVELVCYDNHV